MRVLVLPRDPNPYQGLLYCEMQHLGVQVSYIGELTASRTLNLLLLPMEVATRRIAGARLIHLHWAFAFAFPGARRFPVVRRAAQVWFIVWLRVCRVLRMRLVWTVHNVLPHEPVFADDVSARRALVDASDLVIAHSKSALAELAGLGALARRSAVIPHGPIAPINPAAPRTTPGSSGTARRFLFFGQVLRYKGVEDLLAAFVGLSEDVAAVLTVAGRCDDPELRSRLCALARTGGSRIVLRLERIPEQEVAQLLDAADVVVLPFRRVTTSGSAMLALTHGRPLIIPDLPGLAEIPNQAVLRYDGEIAGLTAALAQLAQVDGEVLASMSAAADSYASRTTWEEIAKRTKAEMLSVLATSARRDVRDRRVRVS
jgi:glycosyltransferase involved in cell wall biosynthesis